MCRSSSRGTPTQSLVTKSKVQKSPTSVAELYSSKALPSLSSAEIQNSVSPSKSSLGGGKSISIPIGNKGNVSQTFIVIKLIMHVMD